MSIKVAQNFDYKGQLPNFERDSSTTLIELRDSNPDWFDDGHISYCKETESHYVFNKDNAFNDKTGYFRIFKNKQIKVFLETGYLYYNLFTVSPSIFTIKASLNFFLISGYILYTIFLTFEIFHS